MLNTITASLLRTTQATDGALYHNAITMSNWQTVRLFDIIQAIMQAKLIGFNDYYTH